MKLNITPEDLMELSDSQKRSLRSRWIPNKYDLAAAFVCMNVETEEMDKIEFVVGAVLLKEINRHRRHEIRNYPAIYDCYDVTLRSLRLMDVEMPEDDEEAVEGDNCDAVEEVMEENFDYTYMRQEDFFNMEYCLPLLNIGQMVNMLQELGYNTDYRINYNSATKKYSLVKLETEYLEGLGFESEELCNVLWNKIKELL